MQTNYDLIGELFTMRDGRVLSKYDLTFPVSELELTGTPVIKIIQVENNYIIRLLYYSSDGYPYDIPVSNEGKILGTISSPIDTLRLIDMVKHTD